MRTTMLTATVWFLTVHSASAELLSDTNPTIRDNLCVGADCVNTQTFPAGRDIVLLRSNNVGIRFEDTSAIAGFPTTDWQINANQPTNGSASDFSIENLDTGALPLSINAGATTSSLHVGLLGNIGMGTSIPATDLHILRDLDPLVRLEQTGVIGIPARQWDLGASEIGFRISDFTAGTNPFRIRSGAPSHSFRIQGPGTFSGLETAGWVGLGTEIPEGKLHTFGSDVQLVYFESSNGGPVQVRFRTDSENRRFLAVNNANEVKTQIIFRDNEILFTGQTDSGANRWLTIGPSGIISRGPTCNPGPCDATFDPEQFEVPPLKERTAYMWENRHLWAVGPTKPGEPINLTEKTGAMLHELEVAYIYIEQLHDTLQAQQAAIDALKADVAALKSQ